MLLCCAIYVNISVFSIFFWFPAESEGQKGEELNRRTLWIDSELKMTGFLYMGEEVRFSSVLCIPPLCPPVAETNMILFSWE